MNYEEFVKFLKKLQFLDKNILQFQQTVIKLEMDIKQLEQKIEDLTLRQNQQHIENMKCDEILLQTMLNNKDCH